MGGGGGGGFGTAVEDAGWFETNVCCADHFREAINEWKKYEQCLFTGIYRQSFQHHNSRLCKYQKCYWVFYVFDTSACSLDLKWFVRGVKKKSVSSPSFFFRAHHESWSSIHYIQHTQRDTNEAHCCGGGQSCEDQQISLSAVWSWTVPRVAFTVETAVL